jgi:sulfite exporter TauE/SafE/copper chaperone CopZ
MNEQKTYTFHVHAMHCPGCVALTESELSEHPLVSSAQASLTSRTVTVKGDFGQRPPQEVAAELSKALSEHSLSIEPEENRVAWGEFARAVPFALGFAALFVLLQKLGIVDLVQTGTVTYGTAFLVGVVASLSTCMAVVGGLLLSLSATFAKEGDTVRPQVFFHAARIIAFFVLGGVVGALGSMFQLGALGTFILGSAVALVMLVLGVNLLDVFPWAKRFQPSVPKFVSRRVHRVASISHTLTPALIGAATFFLPCGFTQSMQLYTLSTGSFLSGGLTMLAFALGTFPVLALVSFSSLSIARGVRSGVFFKSAGLIVIMFALFTLMNSLVAMGWIPPVFGF